MEQLKPMMSMALPAMVGMPCAKTLPIDLSAWHFGHAKIMVQLASNDRMPTMGQARRSSTYRFGRMAEANQAAALQT